MKFLIEDVHRFVGLAMNHVRMDGNAHTLDHRFPVRLRDRRVVDVDGRA